jgi:predicted restriction endonuclease
LPKGFFYCEAHHIRPLGSPHDGPDEESNLVIVCPNHHVLLDYGAIRLSKELLASSSHFINQAHIDYHNTAIHKSPNS